MAAIPFEGSKTKYAAFGIEIGKGTSSSTLIKPGPEKFVGGLLTGKTPLALHRIY